MGAITQFLRRLFDEVLPPNPIEHITHEYFLHKTKTAQRTPTVVLADWAFAPLHYKNPLVRLAIRSLKYRESRHAAELLAHSMHPLILDYLSDKKIFADAEKVLIVPIPLSKNRLRERGYNQALMLALALKEMFGEEEFEIASDILVRTKNTLSQTRVKSREERFNNIAGCFSVPVPEKVKRKSIVLIDDVITTGATVSEARRVLLGAGASEVTTIVAAH